MSIAVFKAPLPKNEPNLGYLPGSPERTALKAKLAEMLGQQVEIPMVIGGSEIRSGKMGECRCPHAHQHLLGTFHQADATYVEQAVEAAQAAYPTWSTMAWEDRAAIFLKAAELLATRFRPILNAATMLGQSKTAFQAEIDSACELIDFFRFNVCYMRQILEWQPDSSPGIWNRMEYRPLEGFVFAVTPFNFTAIAGNLPGAPALLGNVVVWKPASTAVYSAHYLMQLFMEAGLPDGVINMVPGRGAQVGTPALSHPELAGVHFTGSTGTFQEMWQTMGANIENYRSYPRMVGETGGKDFVFAHASADVPALVTALVRGAFEYQGQKCSAASRAYIPHSLWPKVKEGLVDQIATIKMGDVCDFRNLMGAVIDRASFNNIKGYLDYVRTSSEAEILCGGGCDDSVGYFVKPTVVLTTNPKFRTMQEEIFGPVLTIYVYPEGQYEETLRLCDESSPYALTGAIFAGDRQAVATATLILRNAAGNFYINDKPTGAIVGQQPFGGARASGTNDKAGSLLNLLRWVSARAIKENLNPPTRYDYPYMVEE